MRPYWIILIFILCPLFMWAQNATITGRVVNANGKSPVTRASVFLSNATYGTVTADDGSFTLAGVKPGQYDLVVTTVGYEDYSQTIEVGHEPIKLNIELTQKVMMLREVVISSAADWKRNYELFRKDFIGNTDNGKLCKV